MPTPVCAQGTQYSSACIYLIIIRIVLRTRCVIFSHRAPIHHHTCTVAGRAKAGPPQPHCAIVKKYFGPAARAPIAVVASGMLRLLAHVSFYDLAGPQPSWPRLEWDQTMKNDQFSGWPTPFWHGGKNVRKNSTMWRNHTYHTLLASLLEMESYFSTFSRVHVVVDVNEENGFIEQLRKFGQQLSRVELEVQPVSLPLHQPHSLAWVHRAAMRARLASYDWFLYREDDVMIPAIAMQTMVRLSLPLYAATGRTLGFIRVSSDESGHLFFADLARRTPGCGFFRVPSLGYFAPPTNSFAGAWAYPRALMKEFVRRPEWTLPLRSRDVRRDAALGFNGCNASAPKELERIGDGALTRSDGKRCVNSCSIVVPAHAQNVTVYHLSRCGKFFRRTPASQTPFSGMYPLQSRVDRVGARWGTCVCSSPPKRTQDKRL